MKNKINHPKKNSGKKEFPGYPEYPAEEDIFNKDEENNYYSLGGEEKEKREKEDEI